MCVLRNLPSLFKQPSKKGQKGRCLCVWSSVNMYILSVSERMIMDSECLTGISEHWGQSEVEREFWMTRRYIGSWWQQQGRWLWDKKKRAIPQFEDLFIPRPFLIAFYFSVFLFTCDTPLCVRPKGLQHAGRRQTCSSPPSLSLSWDHMTESIEQRNQLSSVKFPRLPGPAKPAPCFSTSCTSSRETGKIFTSLHHWIIRGGLKALYEAWQQISALSWHMRWRGSTGLLFFHFYYHPCFNYSVASISITAAILYLAPPMLTASTFHSKYSANVSDMRVEAAAQNWVQLVTKKKSKGWLSFLGRLIWNL